MVLVVSVAVGLEQAIAPGSTFGRWILPGLLTFTYFATFEGTSGATPGKRMFALRVCMRDGAPVGLWRSTLRTVFRLADGLFAYLLGAILIWSSAHNQRLGDRVAGTIVVDLRPRAEFSEPVDAQRSVLRNVRRIAEGFLPW